MARAAGQVGDVFLRHRVVAARQPPDEFLGSGQSGRPDDFLQGGRGPGHGDVVAHRAGEKEAVLEHHPDLPAHVGHVALAHVVAVQTQAALGRDVEPLDEPGERGFA
ncbi:hypothetical protein DSECCO2_639010 [anaerobic digester metagenome]